MLAFKLLCCFPYLQNRIRDRLWISTDHSPVACKHEFTMTQVLGESSKFDTSDLGDEWENEEDAVLHGHNEAGATVLDTEPTTPPRKSTGFASRGCLASTVAARQSTLSVALGTRFPSDKGADSQQLVIRRYSFQL